MVLWATLVSRLFYFVIETDRNVHNQVLKSLYNTFVQKNEEFVLENILKKYVDGDSGRYEAEPRCYIH